jgi:hypothetical protein
MLLTNPHQLLATATEDGVSFLEFMDLMRFLLMSATNDLKTANRSPLAQNESLKRHLRFFDR